MKQLRHPKGLFEILLMVGIILAIPLFFVIRSQAQVAEPTATIVRATNTPFGIKGNVVASPTAIPPAMTPASVVTKGKEPPACSFPLAQTAASQSKSANYTFSAPQIVLTAGADDGTISVFEWLPDNQRVLVAREYRENSQQDIDLFTPQTGRNQVYATRRRIDQPPVWQAASNAVIYSTENLIVVDKSRQLYNVSRQLFASQGDPKNSRLIADQLTSFSMGVNPQDSQLIYLNGGMISKRNELLSVQQPTSFDMNQWDYRYRGDNASAVSFKSAWRPGTTQVFFYSDGNTQGGYTFLVDVNAGTVCELDFHGWAGVGRWSPDGHYLAIVRATEHYPINSSDLAVLDTTTGKLYAMQVAPAELSGRHYVGDLVWAPDSTHLIAIGYILPPPPTGLLSDKDKFSGLFLVDFRSSQSVHIIPDYKFFAGWPGTNLAWAPDGSKLLIGCPANDIPKLCLIPIQTGKK